MPILSTKLSIPPLRSRLVTRPRLIQILNQGWEYGLVLVSAPAGYGKSTLLSAWLSQVKVPAAWLTLDENDNDLARFLSYLGAALRGIDPALGESLEIGPQASPLPSVETLLTPLVNDLAQYEQAFCLVLDDYHLVQEQAVQQAVGFLLEHRPACLHVVIATRADPPLPLARLRARAGMVEIRLSDLRFTHQEAADFLDHTMRVQITAEDVVRITARTEGWIAGLQIAALSMQHTDDIPSFVASLSGSNYYIFDYLLKEILAHQSPEIRRFLLYTSILDQLTAPLCDALLIGDGDVPPTHPSAVILEELEHANLFVIPLDQQHRWVRYHHLFSDLLRAILEQTYPGQAVELHRRACRWYEAQGMVPAALQHAISSGDMQLVAQIVSANVLALVENDEVVPTLKKIDSIPVNDLISLPWLGIARAWIVETGDAQKVEQILDGIEKRLENAPDGDDLQSIRGHILGVQANLSAVNGKWDLAIAQAQRATELLPADEIVVRTRCLTTWGRGLVILKDYPHAISILEQALGLAQQAEKPYAIIYAAASLAFTYLFTGRMKEVQRVCLEALEVAEAYQQRFHFPLTATSEIYASLSRVHAEWGDNQKAIEYAQKGVSLSEHWGHDAFEAECLLYLGLALVFGNDIEQARRIFQRSEDLNRKLSLWMWQQGAGFILDSLLDGEPTYSSEIALRVRQLQESGVNFPMVLKARLSLRQGKPEEALAELEQALDELQGKAAFITVRIYALQALAYQAKGESEQSLTALQQALALGEPENRVAAFVREGAAMERLLRLAQAKRLAPQFVQRLLEGFASRRKAGSEPAPEMGGLVEPLSMREVEVLKLLAQGYPDKQIAVMLVISRETVHKHLRNIYEKLAVHRRTEAIARARELDLL